MTSNHKGRYYQPMDRVTFLKHKIETGRYTLANLREYESLTGVKINPINFTK